MKIILGFYRGIGDFVSAITAINILTKKYKVIIVLSEINYKISKLINFNNLNNIKFIVFDSLRLGNWKKNLIFLKQIYNQKFDLLLISPHPQIKHTSWKIPLIFNILKFIKKNNFKILGVKEDKYSFLYDFKFNVSKLKPLEKREIDFINKIFKLKDENKTYNKFNIKNKLIEKKSILIHPFASKKNREISKEKLKLLIKELTKLNFKIGLCGENIIELKKIIDNDKINYIYGNITTVIEKISMYEFAITMDSGFAHICSMLNNFKKTIILYFSSSVKCHLPIGKNIKFIFNKKNNCQPCDEYVCKYNNIKCLNSIEIDAILKVIQEN